MKYDVNAVGVIPNVAPQIRRTRTAARKGSSHVVLLSNNHHHRPLPPLPRQAGSQDWDVRLVGALGMFFSPFRATNALRRPAQAASFCGSFASWLLARARAGGLRRRLRVFFSASTASPPQATPSNSSQPSDDHDGQLRASNSVMLHPHSLGFVCPCTLLPTPPLLHDLCLQLPRQALPDCHPLTITSTSSLSPDPYPWIAQHLLYTTSLPSSFLRASAVAGVSLLDGSNLNHDHTALLHPSRSTIARVLVHQENQISYIAPRVIYKAL
ncbi:hypothetical protein BD410DRAFT_846902 [Rickenella mellea]|uniref:Uncharacterized protein n=1 Tax=Rickenella mellea TaxID=50990 RepID=A0A4Y7PDS7_9AGAM|nr:hypothetical protein BD410DRAFT_846902 [Rickenella mellea]